MIPKILLVDDVNMFLDLQEKYLKFSSVSVITARDGAEALQTVKNERPALVFMDLHMPNMDGAECCARLKADAEFRSLPVVMITSEGRGEDRELCFRSGCDDFLTKPLDRVQFLETARRYLPAIDRRDTRIPCRIKAKFKAYGVTLSGEVIDIAPNGIYLAADYEVERGTILEVVFPLPDESGSVIQAKGKVAWLNKSSWQKKTGYPPGFGIEFIALTEASKVALKRYVEKQK
ncbi:MAG TPA: response regulator [Geobacteraceae bacterium]|nr:response regulator [Geobacteraceae bacterium]